MDKKYPIDRHAEIEISLSAILHNLEVVRDQLPDEHKLMAVVKANAYGHGDAEVCRFLNDKVDWLAVNSIREGIRLREKGISLPILVFGVPTSNDAAAYNRYDITATVSDLSHFELLESGTEYHVNFDTGMGRLGIRPDEVEKTLTQIASYSDLHCTGIYTHFATADEPGSAKVRNQLRLFKKIMQSIERDVIVHASNSGGAFFYPKAAFDMVRTGIALYGYPPGNTEIKDLKPALLYRSHLAQTKELKKGDTVSYGAVWKADKDTNIGIIPVGYDDGIRRGLSGKIYVGIDEKLYRQVGTVTMNYIMVDLGRDSYAPGTEVELLNGEVDKLDLLKWARELDTIPYEVLVGFPSAIPRIYT